MLYQRALAGDVLAARELLDRALGKPKVTLEQKQTLPTVKLDDVETELLQFTTTRTAPDAMAPSKEMDLSRIVRPEQFYTDQVSGMAVPIVIERAENCNRSAMFIFNGKMADEFRRNIVKLVAYHASIAGRPTLP